MRKLSWSQQDLQLSGALNSAVEAGLLEANPCRGVRLPRTEDREMVLLTRNEYQLLGRWTAAAISIEPVTKQPPM
jgi:hypothetical protein